MKYLNIFKTSGSVLTLLAWSCFGASFAAVLAMSDAINALNNVQALVLWVDKNLGSALFLFIAVFIFFVITLKRLHLLLLQERTNIDDIRHQDRLSDTAVSLTFGIGVVWTAIGMRDALMAGIGNIESIKNDSGGALVVMQQLVDGGILLALSTTIVGGVLGYLMRLTKSLILGKRLDAYYRRISGREIREFNKHLLAIRQHLKKQEAQ